MALKAVPIWVCGNHSRNQLHVSDSLSKYNRSGSGWNLRFDHDRFPKWKCCPLFALRAETHVEDEKPLTPGFESPQAQVSESKGFQKDFGCLPRPLSATDLSSSPCNGSKVRVAYQGVPGAYSEAAALKAYPKCETVPCDQFEAAFTAVELWLVDKAVLPIENAVAGSIHRNYDLLLCHRLHIVGEVQMVVNHCLLGLPGVKKEELKHVLSHPQALDQCEMTLNNLGFVRISADDTAGAAKKVASDGLRDTAAVASARAAEIYGLDILAERIQDYSNNITRFLILSREPIIPGTDKPHKTSIVFTLEEGPGVLFKALSVFAVRGINLSKIESRPQRKRPLRLVDDSNKGSAKYFDYLFYIDFEASMAEPRAQYALGHLQNQEILCWLFGDDCYNIKRYFCWFFNRPSSPHFYSKEYARFLRVLGCYPMDNSFVNK
ncbi:hypothetical protein F0562_018874 [Nyssa sinensis]|uniref:Arogenate dehydratase n=1 Tax=Nyssa sinensis TaxID=561372 RepID=A0A5J4ZAA4_9ASTE|nr:hypothetical protein F0562_018874 [Nyssa sinensis]